MLDVFSVNGAGEDRRISQDPQDMKEELRTYAVIIQSPLTKNKLIIKELGDGTLEINALPVARGIQISPLAPHTFQVNWKV